MNRRILFLFLGIFFIGFASAVSLNLDWVFPTENINVSQNEFFNVSVNVSCFGGDCGAVNVTLDPVITNYTFTTCGATGRYGPTGENCNSSYSGTSLEGLVNVSNGIQNWTVPATGTYSIEVGGARGGGNGNPGNGSIMKGNFNLQKGDVLKILVGQQGGYYTSGSGGGGTFVTYSNNTPLIVSGGGGGQYTSTSLLYNASGINVTSGQGSGCGAGGTEGSGGLGSFSCNGASGGGGLLGNGTDGSWGYGGVGFIYGGYGGNHESYSQCVGGFGGGGGTHGSTGGGGGGGGYSGGGGGKHDASIGNGGGGGSYNSGTNQTNLIGMSASDGYAIVTFLNSGKGGAVSMDSTATPFYTNVTNPYNLTLEEGGSEIITWWVNATGSIDIPFEFFVYVNQTGGENVSNITSVWNVTIKDVVSPVINITYPLNVTYDISVNDFNYSYSDINPGSCWYSVDGGVTNSSVVSAGTSWTGLNSGGGDYTWILYCNDSSGNEVSDSVIFTSSIPSISLTLLSPTGNVNVTQNEFFEVRARVSCSNNDCGEVNVTLDPYENVSIVSEIEDKTWINLSLSDDSSTTRAIGFNYSFNGTDFSYLCVSSNGFVSLTNSPSMSCSYGGSSISSFTISNSIVGTGRDMNPASCGKVRYYNDSSEVIVFYDAVCLYGDSNRKYTWQIKLKKDQSPELHYGAIADSTSASGVVVVAGVDYTEVVELSNTAFQFCLDGVCNGGGKSGAVSNVLGATPFYTNVTNPYNVSLDEGESATISWWVNATGTINQTYEFFVYANKTSDESINDVTSTWNVTIVENGSYVTGLDESAPTIIFVSPENNSYSSDTGLDIDLTISDPNLDSCWYTYDSVGVNTSLGSGGSCSDINSLVWSEGSHSLTVWANDSGGYNDSSTLVFTIDTVSPSFSSVPANVSLDYGESLSVDFDGVDAASFDSYSVDDSVNFSINSSGGLVNITALNALTTYEIIVTINDSAGNSVSVGYQVSVGAIPDTTNPSIVINSPTAQTYVISLVDFNISADENLSACVVSVDDWVTNWTMSLNSSLTGATYTSSIDDGSYAARFSCMDISGNVNGTESVVFAVDTTNPVVNFNSPTPDNNSFVAEGFVEFNFSITESDLEELKYNWNATNFSLYNDSLVLMMNFDNVSSLGENSTRVVDFGNLENNGTIVEAIWSSNGKYGGGFEFDGINDKISVPNTFGIGTSNFAISVWVNLDSNSESGAFVKIGGVSPNVGFGIGVGGSTYDNSGNDLILLYEGERWIDTNDNIGTGWHHVVMSVDASGYPTAFIDGVLTYSDSIGAGAAPQSSVTYIGGYTGSTSENRYADVGLDEVRIWNRSLSSSEVYQQYVSNLKKLDNDSWELYVNQSLNASAGLTDSNYSYFVSVEDNYGNANIPSVRNVVIDRTSPIVNLVSPVDGVFNDSSNWIDFYYNVSDANSISNCSLVIDGIVNASVSGPLREQKNNMSVYLLNRLYNWSVNCSDVAGNENASETRSLELNYSVVVYDLDFDGDSSNFSERINVSELRNISNLTFEKVDYGRIDFLNDVDLSNDVESFVLNFSRYVNISSNRIEVNSTALRGLNTSARLKLYNLTFNNPQVLKDGEVCVDCVEENYSDGVLTFSVTGFSVYSSRETPILTVPANRGGGGGGGSSLRKITPFECKMDDDCSEGYSCYGGECVKLFDVEILKVNASLNNLDFELDYLIKGMAEINSDVIVKFWLEKDGEKIVELGRDTIYLGSFEVKNKTTHLNLPYDILNSGYDLYVESGYENYKAHSFRKVSVQIPKEVKIEARIKSENKDFFLWSLIGFLILVIVLLLIRRTRIFIISGIVYLKRKIKPGKLGISFKDVEDDEEDEENVLIHSIDGDVPMRDKKILSLLDLSERKVFTTSGNYVGVIEKAILSFRKVMGWVITPDKKYHLNKSIFVKHKFIVDIGEVFLIDEDIENHLFVRKFHSFRERADIIRNKIKRVYDSFSSSRKSRLEDNKKSCSLENETFYPGDEQENERTPRKDSLDREKSEFYP